MKEVSFENDALNYAKTGNTGCLYTGKVIFPINAILAEKLNKGDSVKIILLKTVITEGASENNAKLFQQELDSINLDISANISYETIDTNFIETKQNHEKRLRAMLSKIEEDAEIYADITFGQKPLPMVLMCVLSFAEKFFNADIKKIVYGKVEFVRHDDGNKYPEAPEMYDITFLYYLNNLMVAMEASSGEQALQSLDSFFSL